ncbi:HAD family hydrolase [Flavobacterium sp. '19STA2R22 D10 B1']|uniref:HAD family hydrolase n=1 Tax=Flavobacterium aerium TaxID=3037261 RepID=UPI00278C5829|nr:HAD family hydrolase [Flavobacterium sp. '19STA2R22 D10 B1']
MKNQIKIIAFDADDTLWVNETYFQETEQRFCVLLENYLPQELIAKELFQIEMKNLHLYGYGVKGFMLCMIETIQKVSNGKADFNLIGKTLELGQELLQKPIELLDGVRYVLDQLQGDYTLVMATKGDLLDQERKLQKSGLQHYFHHIEIMSDKKSTDYYRLLKRLDCKPEHFLMLGNSLKSDVIPVLDLNGYAGHIPFHTTWQHEQHESSLEHSNLFKLENITEILLHL